MSVLTADRPRLAAPPTRSAPGRTVCIRAVVRRGLLDRRRSTAIWGPSLGVYGAFMAAIYPSMQSSIDDMLKSYPAGLKEAFGAQAMDTVEGYLHAELFSLIVPLALGYLVIRTVAGATIGAEERGHLDTILALPVSRSVLLWGAFAVAALTSAGIMVATGALLFLGGRVAGTGISLGLVTAGVVGVWPLALFFGGVAAVACGALHSSRSVNGIALGMLVGMYAIDVAGRLSHNLDALRWASVFRYYGAPMRDGIDPVAFIGLLVVSVLMVLAGARLLERRDIRH